MCTVTFIPRHKGYCLGMNRDEKRTRAEGLPPEVRNSQGRCAVYPSEPAGGTWISLNDRGISFALINWYSVTAHAGGGVISRGVIIPSLSAADSSALVNIGLAALPLGQINPFRLIAIFPTTAEIIEWQWDTIRLTRKRHRWRSQQWISSGFDEPRAHKVRSETFARAADQKSAETIGWLRRLHRSHYPQSGPFSTCMHRTDASTVSYTEICVSRAQGLVNHICGPPCQASKSSVRHIQVRGQG